MTLCFIRGYLHTMAKAPKCTELLQTVYKTAFRDVRWKHTSVTKLPTATLSGDIHDTPASSSSKLTTDSPVCPTPLQTYRVEPSVVSRETGKWVHLKGHNKPLVNYTSNDLFAIQTHPDVIEAELRGMSVSGLATNYKCYYKSLPAQKQLQEKLAMLHGQEAALINSQPFRSTLNTWLRKVAKDNSVYVQSKCELVDGKLKTGTFSNNKELQQLLRDDSEGTRLILVEADTTTESIQLLSDVCLTAESYNATVVLLDPQGLVLIRQALGDLKGTLNTLQRPIVIQTSLDLMHGYDSLTYITGPRMFTEWCSQVIPHDSQVIGPSIITKTLQVFDILPTQIFKAYEAILNSHKVKQQLEDRGMTVKGDLHPVLCLDKQSSQVLLKDLKSQGHHVSRVTDGIRIAITGHHEDNDITKLLQDIFHSLTSHSFITCSHNTHMEQNKSDQQSQIEIIKKEKSDVTYSDNPLDSVKLTSNLSNDLQWLQQVYCSPLFDEQLEENLAFFDYTKSS